MRHGFVLCFIISVAITGCGGDSTPSTPPTPPAPDMDFAAMSVAQLTDSLDHEDSSVRHYAASQLGSRREAAIPAIAALTQRLEDDDAGVRLAATLSLSQILPHAKRPHDSETVAALDALRSALADENEAVRKGAQWALLTQEIGPSEMPAGFLEERDSGISDAFAMVLLVVMAIAFTAFAALVFSVLNIVLGKFWSDFEISGPEGWRFIDFYWRYLIIAAVYTFVSLPLQNGFLGIAALAVAYKFVFDAGWTQAIVVGIVGGIIALVLFLAMIFLLLIPLGLFT
jgi:hypothetical protein